MAAAVTHARSSVKRWGGRVEDYLPVHEWFDDTKQHVGDFRHRALRHHTLGVEECIARFGHELEVTIGEGQVKSVPTRWVAEQHLIEDFGHLPTLADWLRCLAPQPWMTRAAPLAEVV